MKLCLLANIFLVTAINNALCYTSDERNAFLMAGVSDIQGELIDTPVTVETGSIPTWLNGNFMRHSCGVFGESAHMNITQPNFISHMFDCLEIGLKFKLENGKATFTGRFYDTLTNDFFNQYGRNMNQSSVFISGTYSKANMTQVNKWNKFIENSTKVDEVPHVSWWQIGNQAIAMTEMPVGVVIDPHRVEQKGRVSYLDNNFGYGNDVMFTNNPAHEQTEKDGTLWSAVTAMRFVSRTHMKIWRIVYKVGADKARKIVGEFHYHDAQLMKCTNSPYPDFGSRFGYLHSFCMTEQYIILPETGYMHDPCLYTHYNDAEPFFPQGFKYEKGGFSRFLVMRKSDGKFVANITAPPFFATHQLGAYEEGDLIHMDMLTYNDASVYDKTTYINSLVVNTPYFTNVTRITIDTTKWTASFRNLRNNTASALEMSNINYAYYGKKYTYGYMIKNFLRADQNAIIKLNVDTGKETSYVFGEGMFAQEPQFIPRPNPMSEDDGVLLVQGVDGVKNKGFLAIIDAKTMTLISHMTAPGVARFGLHNRFFGLEVGKPAVSPDIIG